MSLRETGNIYMSYGIKDAEVVAGRLAGGLEGELKGDL